MGKVLRAPETRAFHFASSALLQSPSLRSPPFLLLLHPRATSVFSTLAAPASFYLTRRSLALDTFEQSYSFNIILPSPTSRAKMRFSTILAGLAAFAAAVVAQSDDVKFTSVPSNWVAGQNVKITYTTETPGVSLPSPDICLLFCIMLTTSTAGDHHPPQGLVQRSGHRRGARHLHRWHVRLQGPGHVRARLRLRARD